MSDDEGGTKKSGYRLEYSSSARAKCKGPKPCSGSTIGKGELRMGSLVDFRGNTSFAWRHWGCVTDKIISNMKSSFETADELDGFDELNEEDQEKIRKAWEDGHVADEDIPETARKPEGDEDEEGEDAKPAKKKATGGKASKKASDDGPGVFKLEYASSGRAKCKGGCDATIAKDFMRLGHEVDFRGNKSFAYQHWGCVPNDIFSKLKQSYSDAKEIDGFADLQEGDREKVQNAWDEGSIPEDDKGPGEPAAGLAKKKAPAKKSKKDDGAPPKKRARKAKKDEDDDVEEEDEEEEEKPKVKRAPAKKAAEKKAKAPAKKRASKKSKDEDEESGEDFGAEIDEISGDEDEDEEEEPVKKSKRAPPAKSSSSKPASKATSKPASKKAASKPSSSRKRKQQDSDDDE